MVGAYVRRCSFFFPIDTVLAFVLVFDDRCICTYVNILFSFFFAVNTCTYIHTCILFFLAFFLSGPPAGELEDCMYHMAQRKKERD